eukprot:scaffold147642_cov22-Tisochrysis_lutea.AAC.2
MAGPNIQFLPRDHLPARRRIDRQQRLVLPCLGHGGLIGRSNVTDAAASRCARRHSVWLVVVTRVYSHLQACFEKGQMRPCSAWSTRRREAGVIAGHAPVAVETRPVVCRVQQPRHHSSSRQQRQRGKRQPPAHPCRPPRRAQRPHCTNCALPPRRCHTESRANRRRVWAARRPSRSSA